MNYRTIFLADDWAHQSYLGWRIVAEEPGLRILGKRRAVVDRFLLLLEAAGRNRLDASVQRLCSVAGFSDVIIHDFDNVLGDRVFVAGRHFARVKPHDTLLNTVTFVIDVTRSDEALLADMNSDYRRKIRKAAAGSVIVDVYAQPDAQLQQQFVAAFRDFAAKRGLNAINGKVLAAMYRDKRGLLLVARKSGEALNFLHLYKVGDAAIFMWGVNLSKLNDGVGQYLHFEAMRRLREQGIRWYDLGGIVSTDPSDGIFNFKAKFGGKIVQLGTELRHTGVVAEIGASAKSTLRDLTGRKRR